MIDTPLRYPGGASVIVRVEPIGLGYAVSDAEFAFRECILLGAERGFPGFAREVANWSGVDFDGRMLYLRDVSEDDLVHAVAAVAHASSTSVNRIATRVAERKAVKVHAVKQVLAEKLTKTFIGRRIHLDFKTRGASNEEWTFDVAVQFDAQLSLFQIVSPKPKSVYEAVASFLDMSDLPPSQARPALIAVLEDRAATRRLRLLERSARTIDLTADFSAWSTLAA